MYEMNKNTQTQMSFEMYMLKGDRQMKQKNYKSANRYFSHAIDVLEGFGEHHQPFPMHNYSGGSDHSTPSSLSSTTDENEQPKEENSSKQNKTLKQVTLARDQMESSEQDVHNSSRVANEEDTAKLSQSDSLKGKSLELLQIPDLAQRGLSKAIVVNIIKAEAITATKLVTLARDQMENSEQDVHYSSRVVNEEDRVKLSQAYYLKGKCLELLQMPDLAQREFSKAIVLNCINVEAITARALLKKKRGYYTLAIDDLNNSIELEPNNGTLFFYRANVKKCLGKNIEALNDYKIAIELGNAPMALVYNNRANLQLTLLAYEAAIEDYSEALKWKPHFATALKNRGVLYYQKRNRTKAISDFTKALELTPDDPVLYTYRGIMYRQDNLFSLAFEDFSKSIALAPKYDLAFKNRSELYQKKGDNILALRDIVLASQLAQPGVYDGERVQLTLKLRETSRKQAALF